MPGCDAVQHHETHFQAGQQLTWAAARVRAAPDTVCVTKMTFFVTGAGAPQAATKVMVLLRGATAPQLLERT